MQFVYPLRFGTSKSYLTYSVYDWLHNFQPFWLGGAVKPWEEENELVNESTNYSMATLFVELPLALPASAKQSVDYYYGPT